MLDVQGAGDDARAAEAVRVLGEIASAVSAGKEPDAYEVLGVPRSAAKADVKKRYWRLSLLIHPDKCAHPRAQEAFAAVNAAAKTLQDESGRAQLDERLEDERLMRIAKEEAQQQQRAAEWARVRGGGGAPLAPVAGPMARESWMTELPPERQAKAGVSAEGMVTSFSQKGTDAHRDSSGWTDTPASRAERLALGAAGPMQLPSSLSAAEARRASELAGMVDTYNSKSRSKSLLEKHLEKQEQDKKDKKKRKRKDKDAGGAEPEAEPQEDWVGKHPWRPFDRERDLGPTLKAKSAQDLVKQAGSLSSRFGSGQGRSFL
uniref:DnaJ-like protein n=1 Tax=Tetraselmis sp. GSL018 TaxID=582737 RepID=A0A061SI49_9CHLO